VSDYGTLNITEGTDVYGSDGDKVGSVVAVRPNYLVVEKGFFFPTDYYIPVSAVSGVEEGRVYLAVTKDAALNQGWDAMPADYESAAWCRRRRPSRSPPRRSRSRRASRPSPG
jgi:hypothetical protein